MRVMEKQDRFVSEPTEECLAPKRLESPFLFEDEPGSVQVADPKAGASVLEIVLLMLMAMGALIYYVVSTSR